MKHNYWMAALFIVLIGCNPESNVVVEAPGAIPQGYPQILKFSQERYNTYVATWVLFAQKYDVSLVPPPVDSVLMIPANLDSYSIDLFPERSDTIPLNLVQSRLYDVIDEWHELFNVSSYELENKTGEESIPGRYVFQPRKIYPYGPNVSLSLGDNELLIHITHTGVIALFIDKCAPSLDIPTLCNFDSNKAKSKLEGKKLIYYDWGGRDSLILSHDTMKRSEFAAVLVSRWSGGSGRIALEYRRAWKIVTPIFYVYVDALTGEDLNYQEQTVIF